ncbi:MAG: uracil-DNA glycosylase family protein, partial [bacterium]
MMNKVNILESIYEQIHLCSKCFNNKKCNVKPDNKKVQRKIVERALKSDVFIVGQALAQNTQRLSGLPYTFKNGEISNLGKILDSLLNPFGYSIDSNSELKYIYSSDIIHCYPGKKDGKDRKPTCKEKKNCFEWLNKELQLVEPSIVILLGDIAKKQFKKIFQI